MSLQAKGTPPHTVTIVQKPRSRKGDGFSKPYSPEVYVNDLVSGICFLNRPKKPLANSPGGKTYHKHQDVF